MKDSYSALAQAYDALMYDVPYAEWGAYIHKLLEVAGCPPGGAVLEYACGTGNITQTLLGSGYSVTALDRSEEMLDAARGKFARSTKKPRLVCADMTDFCLNKPVDAAVCACDGVNYLLTEDALSRFFARAYENIKADGALLFDISSAHKLSVSLGDEFFYDDGEDQTLFWQNSYDARQKTVTMELTLFLRAGEGYTRRDETHIQRAWREQEIREAMASARFGQVRAFGFGTMEPPDREEQRIQFYAKRMG